MDAVTPDFLLTWAFAFLLILAVLIHLVDIAFFLFVMLDDVMSKWTVSIDLNWHSEVLALHSDVNPLINITVLNLKKVNHS